MGVEEVLGFLRTVPPFQFLDEATLQSVAAQVSVEHFPKGSVILRQDGPPSKQLMVIKKGSVKVLIHSGQEEAVIDFRGEGDVFGFLSVVSGDKSRTGIVAIEDSIVYQVERARVLELLETNPEFREYYVKSFLGRFIDRTFSGMYNKSLLLGGDKILFTTPVGELTTRETVTARDTVTIREAAQVMSAENISSLILVDGAGVPSGIVTDRDLREKVVARDLGITGSVSGIMSTTLHRIEAHHLAFEALLTMIRHNIHHLVVVEEDRLQGVVTNHDLMILQGTSPLSLARDIEIQKTIESIAPAARRINDVITLLLKEGAKASSITRVLTEINDRLLRKIIQIAEQVIGVPPLPYCWISFGSEGRKEQTFKTDQDNALIYGDPRTPGEEVAAREFFGRFAAFVNDALVRCGFPECPGNYMARNPQWCQPLRVWEDYFSSWIATPTEEAILRSVILFDFRPVAGDLRLGEQLRENRLRSGDGQGIFLKKLSELTVSLRPPLGFFKTFIVLKSGEHKDQIDIKVRCLTPLINVVRLHALEEGLPETSTLERIYALQEKGRFTKEIADELEQAFEFFLLLRIQHQFSRIEAGKLPDNFINPNELTNLQKRMFREACQTISRALDAVVRQYNPGQGL